MKRSIFAALVCCASLLPAVQWINKSNNKLSDEVIKALFLLNISLPNHLKDANNILQKNYLVGPQEIRNEIAVKTLNDQEVLSDNHSEFLENGDQQKKIVTIEKASLPQGAVAIVPVSLLHSVNEYVFGLLEKYIASLDRVILFMHNEQNEEEAGTLFAKMFDYKYVSYIVATDANIFLQDCIRQLNDESTKYGLPSYIIVTHCRLWNDLIKRSVLGDYRGSECPLLD